MKPKLSICIPTYNRSLYLAECLNSIFQSMVGYESYIEIIISDNASTDNTKQVLDAILIAYPWIQYYRHETNIGAERNFYHLLTLARGDYVWILGDDDKIEVGAIKKIMPHLQFQNSLIICNYSVWGKSFSYQKRKKSYLNSDYIFDDPNRLLKCFNIQLGYISSIIVKTSLFKQLSYTEYEKYVDYGHSFLYSVYVIASNKNYTVSYLSPPIICNRSGNSNNYDWYKVMVAGTTHVFEALSKYGYSSQAISIAKKKILKDIVIPQFFYMKLDANYDIKFVYKFCKSYYASYWRFWLMGIPILFMPAFIVKGCKKIIMLKRHLKKIWEKREVSRFMESS